MRTPSGYAASIYIDYAHTPDALERILETARGLTAKDGRIILVFGCGGDRDRLKRPLMGEIASRSADLCIVTSDNSRSELPENIIGEILAGFDPKTAQAVIPARREAIRYAIEQARGGDVVLLCGKGHEKYEIGPFGRRDFDEAGIAEETLKRLVEMQTKEDNKNEG